MGGLTLQDTQNSVQGRDAIHGIRNIVQVILRDVFGIARAPLWARVSNVDCCVTRAATANSHSTGTRSYHTRCRVRILGANRRSECATAFTRCCTPWITSTSRSQGTSESRMYSPRLASSRHRSFPAFRVLLVRAAAREECGGRMFLRNRHNLRNDKRNASEQVSKRLPVSGRTRRMWIRCGIRSVV